MRFIYGTDAETIAKFMQLDDAKKKWVENHLQKWNDSLPSDDIRRELIEKARSVWSTLGRSPNSLFSLNDAGIAALQKSRVGFTFAYDVSQ